MNRFVAQLAEQRASGRGQARRQAERHRLRRRQALPRRPRLRPSRRAPTRIYELTVLGDLHGCYSCLKGALLQADFFAKLEAWQADHRKPEPKLVLLGDYIDRGMFSYNGVLRTVMQLYLAAPDHVFLLRGNHEYYIEYRGRIYGGVKPAEAINTLIGHVPGEVFQDYMRLFDALPNMLFFDDLLFVHAGIPRDADIKAKLNDMAALNDPDIRFQMLWSDPSTADFIPADLQAQNARFPFGKRQFESFMTRLGLLDDVPRPREGRRGLPHDVRRRDRVARDAVLRGRRRQRRSAARVELPQGDADGARPSGSRADVDGDAVVDRLQAVQRSQAQPVLRDAARDRAQSRLTLASYFVYLLRCADDTLYCGITNDVEARLAAHSAGTGRALHARARPVRAGARAAVSR